jgi:hypothetical protein
MGFFDCSGTAEAPTGSTATHANSTGAAFALTDGTAVFTVLIFEDLTAGKESGADPPVAAGPPGGYLPCPGKLVDRLMRDCSDLAAHLFDLAAAGRHDEIPGYMHPEVQIVIEGRTLSYRDVEAAAHDAMEHPNLTQAVGQRFKPVDANRIAVEGRIRTPVGGAGFSDTPAAWAFVFRGGLLFRSWREPSLAAAIARLEADRSEGP